MNKTARAGFHEGPEETEAYTANRIRKISAKQKTEVPQDPRTINPQVPEGLSHAILRCLEKEKEQRYQTAEEVLADL